MPKGSSRILKWQLSNGPRPFRMPTSGALRFWISRLWDLHLPREASMLKAHDPDQFERILRQRLTQPMVLNGAVQEAA